jgi:hypothetical protein
MSHFREIVDVLRITPHTQIHSVDKVFYIILKLLVSEGFEVTKGLRQGCCPSPTLFKIYVEKALNTWKKKCFGMGYNAVNTIIYALQFADDQVVMAQSKEDLEYMGRKLQEEYSKWGFTINIAKTKFMPVGTDTNHLEMDNDDIISGCTKFRYLGTIFPKDGRDNKNIRHGVTQAPKIVGSLNGVWWSKNITRNRKKIIYNSMVKSALIYGAETWSLYEDDRRRINAIELDALRR